MRVVQGDTPFKWRTDEFRMFEDGSMWRPPQMNPFSQGMPDELVEGGSSHAADDHGKKLSLTDGYMLVVIIAFSAFLVHSVYYSIPKDLCFICVLISLFFV